MDRRPVVAGQFYPGTHASLDREVRRFLKAKLKPRKALAVVAPHAGYIYSGAVAGMAFGSVEVPRKCVVLSPNHTGMGERAAVWAVGSWEIPTGKIPVDEKLAKKLMELSPELREDTSAHLREHSLEVELPFLFAKQPSLEIVPVAFSRLSPASCRSVGSAIAKAIKGAGEEVLIVASTDMNHYEDQASTLAKDRQAIERVLALDPEGLLSVCGEEGISMCGVVPTAVAIFAALELGAKRAELVEHKTSGDVSGDYDAVVGYAAFVIE